VRSTFAVISISSLFLACRQSPPSQEFVSAPDSIQASFTHFADSVLPTLISTLQPLGYHAGDSDTTPPTPAYRAQVSQASLQDSRKQLWFASILLLFHQHLRDAPTFPMPVVRPLFFGGNSQGWMLITTDGYLYTLGPTDGPRSNMPLDFQIAVRRTFVDQIDLLSWARSKEQARGGDSSNTTQIDRTPRQD
jgi:hypothetical protein